MCNPFLIILLNKKITNSGNAMYSEFVSVDFLLSIVEKFPNIEIFEVPREGMKKGLNLIPIINRNFDFFIELIENEEAFNVNLETENKVLMTNKLHF